MVIIFIFGRLSAGITKIRQTIKWAQECKVHLQRLRQSVLGWIVCLHTCRYGQWIRLWASKVDKLVYQPH